MGKEKEFLHYTTCGLDYIWLKSGFEKHDTSYGSGYSIHDIDGLHRAIGVDIAQNKPVLKGQDIRYLRRELDLSQVQIAQIMGVDESTVRNWENDRRNISGAADKVLRKIYLEYVNSDGPLTELIERIGKLNREEYQARLELEETEQGWRASAA